MTKIKCIHCNGENNVDIGGREAYRAYVQLGSKVERLSAENNDLIRQLHRERKRVDALQSYISGLWRNRLRAWLSS